MSTIASLNVSVVANVSKFTSVIQKSSVLLKTFTQQINLSKIAAKSLDYGTIGLAAGAAASAYMVQSKMAEIKATTRLADSLNIGTRELVGYGYAAKRCGIDQEEFNAKLGKFQERFGAALLGGTELDKPLNSMGISLRQFPGLDTAGQLQLIADKFKTMSSSAEKAAIAEEFFGRGGAELAPMLSRGSEGLAEAVAKVDQLGIGFSRVDAGQVELATRSVASLSQMLEGVYTQLAIKVSPFIIAAKEHFESFGKSGIDVGEKVTTAFEWVLKSVAKLADYWELLKAGWLTFEGATRSGIAGLSTGIGKLLTRALFV